MQNAIRSSRQQILKNALVVSIIMMQLQHFAKGESLVPIASGPFISCEAWPRNGFVKMASCCECHKCNYKENLDIISVHGHAQQSLSVITSRAE